MARLRSKTGTYDQGVVASSTAPQAAFVGQIWYNSNTGVTYQYTTDGTSKFWLDLTSGGIGESTARSVNYVGDTDPLPNHNGGSATLAVGHIYYNRETDRYFTCTNATDGSNVWVGRYAGVGGIVTSYLKSSTYYRVHTFLDDGTMVFDSNTSCDILMIGGGGPGGSAPTTGHSPERGGGGGAGGMLVKTSQTITAGIYDLTIGHGGWTAGNTGMMGGVSTPGGNTTGFTFTAHGGGPAGHQGTTHSIGSNRHIASDGTAGNDAYVGGGGASGGGAHGNSGGTGGQALHGTSSGTNGDTAGYYGSAGGASTASSHTPGGGGGSGTAGAANQSSGGNGAGLTNTFRTNVAQTYSVGGPVGIYNTGTPNTGNGGGGGAESTAVAFGGHGGSGIIVVRYALN